MPQVCSDAERWLKLYKLKKPVLYNPVGIANNPTPCMYGYAGLAEQHSYLPVGDQKCSLPALKAVRKLGLRRGLSEKQCINKIK